MFRKNVGLTRIKGSIRVIQEDNKRRGNIFSATELKSFSSAKYLKMIKIILTAANNWGG